MSRRGLHLVAAGACAAAVFLTGAGLTDQHETGASSGSPAVAVAGAVEAD